MKKLSLGCIGTGIFLALSSLTVSAATEVNSVSALNAIIANNEYVVVDFYSPQCPPCQRLLKILPSIEEELKDVVFVKVSYADVPELFDVYNVMSFPTLIIIKNGKVVGRTVGFKSKKVVITIVKGKLEI